MTVSPSYRDPAPVTANGTAAKTAGARAGVVGGATIGARLDYSVPRLPGPCRRHGQRDGRENGGRPDGIARQGNDPRPADPVVERAADHSRCDPPVPDTKALDECRRHGRKRGIASRDRAGEQCPDRFWRGALLDG